MNVPRRYGVLRVISIILKVIAWIVLAAGLIVGISGLVNLGGRSPAGLAQYLQLAYTIAAPVLAVFWFVQLFAFGSVLSLLVDIEENTRALAATGALPPAPAVPAISSTTTTERVMPVA